jgi:hypothetical protein
MARPTNWHLPFLPALVLAVGIGACSDDDSPDTTAETSDAEQVCDDWTQLQAAVTALADVDVVADGTDALRTAVDGVTGALEQLRDSAGEAAGDEVDALGSAVDELTTEVSGLADGSAGEGDGDGDPADEGAGSGLVAVGEAVQGVATATEDLGAELQPDCDA